MPWIRTIAEDEASGPLARLYESILDPDSGRVAHILGIQGLDHASLRGHLGLYRAVMAGSETFSKADAEMIAWTVSITNECHY